MEEFVNAANQSRELNEIEMAAYIHYGLVEIHPFVDGNKRAALAVAETFLGRNGFESTATDAECVTTFIALAAGEIGETALADWFRKKIRSKR